MKGPDGTRVPQQVHLSRACCAIEEDSYCGDPGEWHIMWQPGQMGSWACDIHMAELVAAGTEMTDRHPVGAVCGIGQRWRDTLPPDDWGWCETDLFDGLFEEVSVGELVVS